jgi:mannose-6-phosphate isomerase-like protein (cupin superfamily)
MTKSTAQLDVAFAADASEIRSADWGGMTCAHITMEAGTDFTPLLEGLENDHCQVPHWGYVIDGRVRVTYEDGTEEVVEGGQLYYWPPGHTARFDEDTEYVEFSPQEGMHDVLDHVKKKMAAA